VSEQHANFRRLIAGLEVRPALDELAAHEAFWGKLQVRQQYEGSAHIDTEMIPLRAPTTLEGIFDNLDSIIWHQTCDALPVCCALVEHIAGFLHARELGRVMLVRLAENGWIRPHVDEGAYARYFARFHLSLDSTPQCMFRCGEEQVHMAPGELWWFNHQVRHSVFNKGPARIHLIMDFAAPGFTGAIANIRVP
jgi:hypothetical protein